MASPAPSMPRSAARSAVGARSHPDCADTFFWAATPTCSNGVTDFDDDGFDDGDADALRDGRESIGPLLLSAEGLNSLVDAGELTEAEVEAMLRSGLPPSQYAYILCEWVGLYAMDGLRSGSLRGGGGFEENLLRQLGLLRSEYFNIGDYAAGRMPLAYVQLVQVRRFKRRFTRRFKRCYTRSFKRRTHACPCAHPSPRAMGIPARAQVLIDSLVVLAPFALYPELGVLSVPATGLLTLFFKGLLELSKSFLDPFGNEGSPGQNIRVDVLVSELNFGAASRWVRAGAELPSPTPGDASGQAQGAVVRPASTNL